MRPRDRSNRLLGLRFGITYAQRRSIGCTLSKPLPPTISWPRQPGIARQTRLEPQRFASLGAAATHRIGRAHKGFQCMFRRAGDGQMFAQWLRQVSRRHQTRYQGGLSEQGSISSVYPWRGLSEPNNEVERRGVAPTSTEAD